MSLANLIKEFPEMAEKSKFIFIPGPNDPGLGQIFPRLIIIMSIMSISIYHYKYITSIAFILYNMILNYVKYTDLIINVGATEYMPIFIVLLLLYFTIKLSRTLAPHNGDTRAH